MLMRGRGLLSTRCLGHGVAEIKTGNAPLCVLVSSASMLCGPGRAPLASALRPRAARLHRACSEECISFVLQALSSLSSLSCRQGGPPHLDGASRLLLQLPVLVRLNDALHVRLGRLNDLWPETDIDRCG